MKQNNDPLDMAEQQQYIDAESEVAYLRERLIEILGELKLKFPYYRFEMPNNELMFKYEGVHRDEELSLQDLLEF